LIGLDWIGLGIGLDWIGLMLGLDWIGLMLGLDWIDWIGLDSKGQCQPFGTPLFIVIVAAAAAVW